VKLLKKLSRISHINSGKKLFIIDEENRAVILNEHLALEGGFKLKLPPNKPGEKGVKLRGDYLAVSIGKDVYVFDIQKKKRIAKFSSKHDVLAVGMDEENRYIAFGGIDGRVYFYNLEINKEITSFKHRDFITDIEIVGDLEEIAAGSFDKAVIFYNLLHLKKKERYLHIRKVKKIEQKEHLISADEISDIVVWDCINIDKKDRVDFYKEFRDFFIDDDILVILSSYKISLYDLKSGAIIKDEFLQFYEGDKIAVYGNYMIVSNLKGEVYYHDLFEEEGEFLNAILKQDFKAAYKMVIENPYLKRSRGYERLERMVELIIKRAKQLFEVDKTQALKLLSKLSNTPKEKEVQKVIKHYENLSRFKEAIKKKNYQLAYILANQYPLLKETKYYEYLEKLFKIAYNKALKLLNEDKIEEAKEVLKPFALVSEKMPIISSLLQKAKTIELLREKLAKRDFKGFFAIIEQNPDLKKLPEYKKVLEYAKKLYEKAQEFIQKEEFEKAKEIALILKDFPMYVDKAEDILLKIEVILNFMALINTDTQKALEMVEIYPFLKNLSVYREFIKEFNHSMMEIEKLLSQNKEKKAKKLAKKYKFLNRVKSAFS